MILLTWILVMFIQQTSPEWPNSRMAFELYSTQVLCTNALALRLNQSLPRNDWKVTSMGPVPNPLPTVQAAYCAQP